MKSGWWSRIAVALFWVGCFAVVLGGVAEGYLSHQGYVIDDGLSYKDFNGYDAYLGWIESRGTHKFYEIVDKRHYITHIWPDTSRRSRPQQAKKCSKRVLLLGCSHTHGQGISDEDTFAWQLNERFPDVAFDNFGVNGYSTYQCYLREKQQLLMHPNSYDLVLYSAFEDHLNRNNDWDGVGAIITPGGFLLRPRVDYSNQGELLFYSGERHWPWDDMFILVNFAKRVYYAQVVRLAKAENNEQFSKTKCCLFWELNRRMAEQAQQHGAQYGLVWLCEKRDWKTMLVRRRKLHDNYPWPQNPGLWGAEPEYPCLCIDLDEGAFQRHQLLGDSRHYDRYIHSVWAKKIGDWAEALLREK